MNAIEMAVTAGLTRIMNGLQERIPELIDRLPELIEKLPPDIQATIGQIGKSVAGFQAQLDRIEARQLIIMSHMDIPTSLETKELPNADERTN